MKKLILSAIVVLMAFAMHAQEIPERKGDKPVRHERKTGHHKMGMDMQQLNLTNEQKKHLKQQRETFHSQMEELKKNDGITVKESRTRMESLRKAHMEKIKSILTTEQKAQMEKMRVEGKAKHEEMANRRGEKMKSQLGLTDEQSAKMQNSRKEMADKMKAIRENKSITEENKKEQIKELMKAQKEQMKTILTKEQLKKMKETKREGHGGRTKSAEKNTTI